MLARLNRLLAAHRRRRSTIDTLAHLDARLLADVGLRRTAGGDLVERAAAD